MSWLGAARGSAAAHYGIVGRAAGRLDGRERGGEVVMPGYIAVMQRGRRDGRAA